MIKLKKNQDIEENALVEKKNLAIKTILSIENELEIDMINEFLEIYKKDLITE